MYVLCIVAYNQILKGILLLINILSTINNIQEFQQQGFSDIVLNSHLLETG